MPQITIIGMGTVGQSLGLALHHYMQTTEGQANRFTIVGYDPEFDARRLGAIQPGTVTRTVGDILSAVRDAPFVILALPTWRIYQTLRDAAPHLAAGATVTDTAPNKRLVLQWASELLPQEVNFVGGHPFFRRMPTPMLLPDEVVDEPAAADLFREAPYCIMPAAHASEAAVNQVISMAEAVGAKPFFTDPYEHDSFQAAVHDLPVLSSYALMRVLAASPSWNDMGPLAGAAFREATRMASSDPQVARADLVANRENLLGWIDRYQMALQEMRDLVANSDPADLEQGPGKTLGAALTDGRNARTTWVNPHATAKAAPQAADDAQSHSFIRNLFGGFLVDRMGGDRSRDADGKGRR